MFEDEQGPRSLDAAAILASTAAPRNVPALGGLVDLAGSACSTAGAVFFFLPWMVCWSENVGRKNDALEELLEESFEKMLKCFFLHWLRKFEKSLLP